MPTENKKYPGQGARGKGRATGSKNKMSLTIQEGLFDALTELRGDRKGAYKFFKQMREEHPVQFLAAVTKLLPQQVKADVSGNTEKTWTIKLIDTRQKEEPKQIKQAETINLEQH